MAERLQGQRFPSPTFEETVFESYKPGNDDFSTIVPGAVTTSKAVYSGISASKTDFGTIITASTHSINHTATLPI